MMSQSKKYLAWDTSSANGVIAAFELNGQESKLVVSWTLSLEAARHSERLLWSIDTVLTGAGWKPEDLAGLVVGVGPGSFTGLRIGITTAKIFSTELSIPVYPISSLELLEEGFLEAAILGAALSARPDLLTVVCTDATKGEWFCRLRDPSGESQEFVTDPEDLLKRIESASVSSWVILGQSAIRYPQAFEQLPESIREKRVSLSESQSTKLSGSALMSLGLKAILAQNSVSGEVLVPRYLRASAAEVKLKKGLLAPQKLQID